MNERERLQAIRYIRFMLGVIKENAVGSSEYRKENQSSILSAISLAEGHIDALMQDVSSSRLDMQTGAVGRTKASIEAVAAFLYNTIYDQDGSEGWTPKEPAYDPTYREVFLCFAEAVMKVLEAKLEVSGAEIVQLAAKLIDRKRAGFSWEFITVDGRVVSLLQVAEPYIDGVRDFLDNPGSYPEGAFLQ